MTLEPTPAPAPEEGTLFGRRQPPPAPRLPRPWSQRFSPLRAGILNLWEYDQQELRFEQGRLLLRGDNGTGKSKALELLLPFLLDADLSPQRLDPFAGTARTMYWNLLMGDRYESRVGYVWLELGRRREAGEAGGDDGAAGDQYEEYWTLGCGLRATRRSQRVDSWYFVTHRRVGAGLELLSPNRVPLLKDELRRAIGEDGTIYDTGRDYRERLDHLFFSLGGERFAALRHLLLQLRRPQLSQKLDPRSLGELLNESLPPVDPDLVGQVSESFERLDQDQRELARVEAAAREVETFLGVYREYARGMARSRAAGVRQADSRYHKTAAEAREADAERERMAEREGHLRGREAEVAAAISRTRGEIQALAASEAMRSAEVLRARRERADDLERGAAAGERAREEAQRAWEAAGDEEEAATAEAREAEAEREGQARRTVAAAEEAGLEGIHATAARTLTEAPPAERERAGATAAATVTAAVERRREAVAELQTLAAERDRTRERHARAQDRRAEAEQRCRQAAERTAGARRELEAAREELSGALVAWRGSLEELVLDEAAFAELEAAALAPGEPEGPGAAAVLARLAARQEEERVRAIRDEERAGRELDEEQRATADERRRVEEAQWLGPEPPRTREAADRESRPGAPLYLLCEFSEALGEEERAGLEAALEASGLLDAWVTPEGRLLAPGTLDTVLVASPREGTGSLAELLVPAPGHGVAAEVVEAVLRSLDADREAGPDAASDGPAGAVHKVGLDGSWRLGPLQGAWAKPAAQHVGAAAREAARVRRLAELDRRLAELDRELEVHRSRLEQLQARLDRLRRERQALPPADALLRARHAWEAAAGEEERRRDELGAAEAAAAEAHQALEAAQIQLTRRARELELEDRLADLSAYLLALERYAAAFRALLQAVARAAGAAARRERTARRRDDAGAQRDEAARRAVEATTAARQARAEVETLEATVGAEARRVVEQHAAARERLESLEGQIESLREEREAAREERIRAEERAELYRRQLEERDGERRENVDALRRLAAAGLLALVVEELPTEAPEEWSLTRALELAREIESLTEEVDLAEEAVRRRVNRLHERFQRLGADLGADYQPSLRQEGELNLVRVLYNGKEHDLPALAAVLDEVAEVRRGLLAEHERELLRRFLLGEVGDHLRHRLRQARELVKGMNEQLARCATSSGMVLRLAWQPDAGADPEIRAVVELLRRDPGLLPDADRRRLEGFFQRQIGAARESWESVPWREHLMQALDYRRWHRFRIEQRSGPDGPWQDLTRHRHAAISGGEKAVALHLPLFAAAAAHYRSARPVAPRLVLLDEAFAGIDQGMRGRSMGLLVDFDLDFMMTSHEEWGCYEELPGLAIYQLYRDPALEGVAAVPFLWRGRRLQEGVEAGAEDGG